MAATDTTAMAGKARSKPSWFKTDAEVGRLNRLQLVIYGVASIPIAVFLSPLGYFLPPFYTSELGLSLTAWGLVILFSRIWDMIGDPIIGVICDRYPSALGRRRHWLLIATPLLMISVFVLFMPQFFVGQMTFAYALAAMCFMQTAYSIYALNSQAWGAELSDDYHERSRILGWRAGFALLAPVFAMVIGASVEQLDPNPTQREKLLYIGILVLVTLIPLTLLLVKTVGERPPMVVRKEPIRFVEGLKALGRNKLMVRLLVIDLVAHLPFSITGSLLYFYMAYILEAPRLQSILSLIAFSSAILATPIWLWISKPFDKNKILAFSYLAVVFTSAPLAFLGPGDAWIAIGLIAGSAFFHTGPAFLLRSITADVVDSDTLETGEQRTGTFFAIVEMAQKFAPTVGVALVFPLLDYIGFDATGKNNTPFTLDMLRYLYGLSPLVPLVVAAILLWKFPMDRKAHEALQEKLAARRAAAEA